MSSSSSQAARIARRCSSVTRPRRSNGTPSASNSCRAQPAPTPSTSRPPLSCCRLAAIRATSSGCRYGTISTLVPSLMRLVRAASQASVVNGSKNGGGYRPATSGVSTTWSDTISTSNPSPSATCAQRHNRSGSVPGPKFGTLTPSRILPGYRDHPC
nr:hypothetical protein [Nonomuraea antri]